MTEMHKLSKIDQRIEEYYQSIFKTYGNAEIFDMCKNCEKWNGKDHDYEECRGSACFRFFCAYGYLKWATSWEGETE